MHDFWPILTALGGVGASLAASLHTILYKRDSRAAVAWVGLIWLVPFVGALLYLLFGINRVRRRVAGTRGHENDHISALDPDVCAPEELLTLLPVDRRHLLEMTRLGETLSGLALLRGNSVEPLVNGDQAYPAMLAAIEGAKRSISMATYIFDSDRVGRRFLNALGNAVDRGVEVCVLVDAVGARYSYPPISALLRERGIRTARFMSRMLMWRTPYLNLRNHRKILVVDGHLGFTGE